MLLLSLILLKAGFPEAAASEAAPCAACVTWEVTTAQTAELLAAPGSLDGLDLLIRSHAGEPVPARPGPAPARPRGAASGSR